MEAVLLHNPGAGDSNWSRRKLEQAVRRAGVRPRYFPLDDALKRPRRLGPGDFVIVAGGDGALRRAALALRRDGRPIAPLPLGTANNIARSLGLTTGPEEIMRAWKKGLRRVNFDLGIASGSWGRQHFVEGAGLGLIGRTIKILDEVDEVSVHEWKKAEHRLHRDACVAAVLAHEMAPISATVEMGRSRRRDEFLLLEILNIRRAGPAVVLAPRAQPADGKFDVVSVTVHQRRRLLGTLMARLADAERVRDLTTRHARFVRLKPARDCELRIDDGCIQLAGGKQVDFTIEPGALGFLVPVKA